MFLDTNIVVDALRRFPPAVTALEYKETLYTKNVRHFRMISGLTVVRPY